MAAKNREEAALDRPRTAPLQHLEDLAKDLPAEWTVVPLVVIDAALQVKTMPAVQPEIAAPSAQPEIGKIHSPLCVESFDGVEVLVRHIIDKHINAEQYAAVLTHFSTSSVGHSDSESSTESYPDLKDFEKRVNSLLKGVDKDKMNETVVKIEEYEVSHESMQTLRSCKWLNDQIVNAYLKLIENYEGNVPNCTIKYYDSLKNDERKTGNDEMERFLENLKSKNEAFRQIEWTYSISDIPLQTNKDDCGVLVRQNARKLAEQDSEELFDAKHVEKVRREMVFEIGTCALLVDWKTMVTDVMKT